MVIATVVNALLVALVVLIHAEALRRLSLWLPHLNIRSEFRVIAGLSGAICAHIIEVWIFGFAYYLAARYPRFGSLQGNYDGSLLDSVYFSFTTYSSLGLGDIEPLGPLRFLVGLEALTGLVLITWTASFMFIEMQKYWERHSR